MTQLSYKNFQVITNSNNFKKYSQNKLTFRIKVTEFTISQ